tara:strand:+ start:329 stop:1207 length:879 start_codon:yes stop_codon:yes gene_type:complete
LAIKKLFVWTCDYSNNSGEGKLARLFLNNLSNYEKYKIILKEDKNNYKYISPLIGILYCWEKFLNNEKVCYLNYLPFWNFLIFILLPPRTLLGPITGGANFSKSFSLNFFIRTLLFPIFYRISEFFVSFRNKKLIFSTDLLKKHISYKNKKNYEFNFIIKNLKIKKKQKKSNDFVIYYRKHVNKLDLFPHNFIKKLVIEGFKIIVVGDELKIKSIKNIGYVDVKTINKIQSKSKFTIASNENIYSFFTLECLSNNVKIIVDRDYKNQVKYAKKEFLILDLKKFKNFVKLKSL